MLRLVITTAVLIAISATAQAHSKSKCPFALGKYPFDSAKFAGEWNLLAAAPFKDEKLGKCAKGSLSVQKQGEEETMSGHLTMHNVQDNKPMNFEVLMHCLIPKTGIVLAVFKKDDSDKWSDVYKKSILATDYTSYALTLSCKQKFDEKTKEFTRHAVPEIWSRNLTLSQDVMDTLVNVVSGYDIDPSTIQKIDHTNCK